jgi:hypothetical protein
MKSELKYVGMTLNVIYTTLVSSNVYLMATSYVVISLIC